MHTGNNLIIKSVCLEHSSLPLLIMGAIDNPSPDKVIAIIKSYNHPDHEMLGAFMGDTLVGILGICKTSAAVITMRHISVLPEFQRHGVGTLLLNAIMKCHERHRIIAETDQESVGFYLKSGFSCNAFEGIYGTLRYTCVFNNLCC
jgi:GNAT superfamily N-acetyltransferase